MFYKLKRKLNTKEVRGTLSKSLDIHKNKRDYKITFDVENEFVEVTALIDCPEVTPKNIKDNLERVKKLSPFDGIDSQLLSEMQQITSDKSIIQIVKIFKELNSLLSELDLLIRHELNQIMHNQKLFGDDIGFYFRENHSKEWVSINSLYIRTGGATFSMKSMLTNHTLTKIEKFTNDGFEITLAREFLEIAYNSKSPKNIWVSTTTALEVGIKEALIHLDPRLENIFLRINSPSLVHLYKSVLKDYTGHESPFYKDVQYGTEIRNMIVHKPEKLDIDQQHSINYAVRAAYILLHLSHLVRATINNSKFKNPVKRVNTFQRNKYKPN